MKTITWLHFSDLHLCRPKTGWESDRILIALKEDLVRLDLRPDLIFFTGDAVFGHIGQDGGKSIAEQFDEAALFFEEIREIYSPPVPIENFFIVPGNHEVNRSKVDKHVHTGLEYNLQGDYAKVEKELSALIHDAGVTWRGCMERLSDYRSFLEENGYHHLLEDPERLTYATERELSEREREA